jgi:hypothetical protein
MPLFYFIFLHYISSSFAPRDDDDSRLYFAAKKLRNVAQFMRFITFCNSFNYFY